MWTKFEAGQVKGSPDELSNIPGPALVVSSCNPSVAYLPSILPVWTTGEGGLSEICWASAEPVEWFDRAGESEARHIVLEKAFLGVAHVGFVLPLPTVWLVVIVKGWMYPEILLGLVDISSLINYGTVSQVLGLGPCIMVGCLSMNRHIVYCIAIDATTRGSTGCHHSLVVTSDELVINEIFGLRKPTDPGPSAPCVEQDSTTTGQALHLGESDFGILALISRFKTLVPLFWGPTGDDWIC